MLFNSLSFLFVFLPIALAGFAILSLRGGRHQLAWLLAASLVFYAFWDAHFAPIIIVSVVFNYLVARWITATAGRLRFRLLSFAVAANLAALAYFKYTNFLLATFNQVSGAGLSWTEVVLPIGISFFTFQQIAFLVDSYRQQVREDNFIRYATFVCFFPHLIAGPIVHPREILPQFKSLSSAKLDNFAAGATLLIIGLFKKVIIADTVAVQSTAMFKAVSAGGAPGLVDSWIGTICYALQIYFDFSAYSDMAVGLARMFGIAFPINFASPYKAMSITDFWRRWHITLSRFLRDYLYIPLGGNRAGRIRQGVNLMIVMTVGGFWHGAGWTFVLWGALHGVYLLVHRWWIDQHAASLLGRSRWWPAVACGLTFIAVLFAWVPFRADGLATTVAIWKGMIGAHGMRSATLPLDWGIAVFALAMLPVVFFAPNAYEIMATAKIGSPTKGYPATTVVPAALQWQPSRIWAIVLALMLAAVLLRINDASEFIYFQF